MNQDGSHKIIGLSPPLIFRLLALCLRTIFFISTNFSEDVSDVYTRLVECVAPNLRIWTLVDTTTNLPLLFPLFFLIDRLSLRPESTQSSTLQALKFFMSTGIKNKTLSPHCNDISRTGIVIYGRISNQ